LLCVRILPTGILYGAGSGLSSIGMKNVKFLIKKEAFFFPLGYLIKALGALPVDRSRSAPLVMQVVKMFNEHKQMYLVITPEGTRKLNKNWKKGFFNIAREAGVPILLGYLDYKTKTGGLGPIITCPDDYDKTLEIIQEFYKDKQAKYPENFSLSPMHSKLSSS
jgi:1-acyl-sn-glycerol-3-phosphate acyltransferase